MKNYTDALVEDYIAEGERSFGDFMCGMLEDNPLAMFDQYRKNYLNNCIYKKDYNTDSRHEAIYKRRLIQALASVGVNDTKNSSLSWSALKDKYFNPYYIKQRLKAGDVSTYEAFYKLIKTMTDPWFLLDPKNILSYYKK